MEYILLVFNLMTHEPDRFMFRHTSLESCNKMARDIVTERYNKGKSVQFYCIPQADENIFQKTSISL